MGLHAGVAREIITPELDLEGSFRLHPDKRARGVHDDLAATAVWLDGGGGRILLVSLDLLALSTSYADALKERLRLELGLLPHEVLLSCTHTHNAQDVLDEEGRCDPRLKAALADRIAAAARRAVAAAAPARAGWGDCAIPFSFNRQFPRLFGMDEVSGGPVDPICDILRIERDGEAAGGGLPAPPLALLYHYSAHPTAAMRAGFAISRDYPGVCGDILERELGGTAAFLQGAAGDVNLVYGERTFARADEKGRQMAERILAAARGIACSGTFAVRGAIASLDIPNRTDLPAPLDALRAQSEAARAALDRASAAGAGDEERWRLYNAWRVTLRKQRLAEENLLEPSTRVVVQAVRLGDAAVVTAPGEFFVGHQLALRRALFPRRAMLFGYANGYVGYVPTSAAAPMGGYGAEADQFCRLRVGGGEEMLAQGLALLKSLEP